jgi:hypothetical protein
MRIYSWREIITLLEKADNLGLYLGINSPLEKLTLGELDLLLNGKDEYGNTTGGKSVALCTDFSRGWSSRRTGHASRSVRLSKQAAGRLGGR